ncbi:MAG: exodeoxyribonuclease V subunit gamma [Desulfamplus sp.]|nr:exodeoxyribonuclease V subunit gamma [Desulfamplus sp.]
MTGIKLYRSNSIEELADALAENVKSPLSSPLSPEIILVQSLGMAKWVNLELAKRLGVWANSKLLFPNTMINSLFSKVLPNVDEKLFLEREMLTWTILNHLMSLNYSSEKTNPDHHANSAYNYALDNDNMAALSNLATYCKGNEKNLTEYDINFREFQLARQLAMTYDQYLTYRPELIELWETRGTEYKNDNWQAILWRYICQKGKECIHNQSDSNAANNNNNILNVTHKAARRREFLEAVNSQNSSKSLPERISVFGIPSLPLFHLEILASISALIDVSFYVMTPAKGYFSDLRSAKQKMKREHIGDYMGITSGLLHIETGNPLLASLGRAGADFMESLLDYDNLEDIDRNFIEPSGNTILSMVQKDILLMQDRGITDINQEHTILNKDENKQHNISKEKRTLISLNDIKKDRSIVVSSCHSPMREVEVLNDYLLELFDSNLNITPADVLVMTPDIERYAPFVRAVFTTPEEDRLKIPFSIADLGIKSVSRTVDVFMNILSLPQTRFEVPFIMDILECDDVARRFALEARDIDLVREWIKETAIRWGKDGKYRERIGLPRFEENSWRAGLDRLMAGYAMTGRGEQLFMTSMRDDDIEQNREQIFILPCDSVEGNSSAVLGSLSRFFTLLSSTAEKMAANMTLSEWSDFLMSVTEQFFLPDEENADMVQQIRKSLNDLKRMEEITGFTSPVNSRIIKSWCDQAIGKEYRDSNFLNGGVTFCAMLPMRSIPAKVICILGLNDKIFPRMDSSPNFDLIRQKPRRGDRSLRNEDRYLFLETIISAREKLYLSYTGQGIEDNIVITPSVVISELMDYLDQGFVVNENHLHQDNFELSKDEPLSSYILTHHPLQAFSPAYFEQACVSDLAYSQKDLQVVCSDKDSDLFSYSKGNFSAASALRRGKRSIKPFISDSIT